MDKPPFLRLPVAAAKDKPTFPRPPAKPPVGGVIGPVPPGQPWPPWTGLYPPGTIQNYKPGALPPFRGLTAHPAAHPGGNPLVNALLAARLI